MKSDNICVVTSPDDSVLVVDAPKNWGKSVHNMENSGDIWTWRSGGGKKGYSISQVDNVRSVITLLQNEDPVFENSVWKNPGLLFAAGCVAGCRGRPPAWDSGARQGAAGNFAPMKLCWNLKTPTKLARTLVRDVNFFFFCDHMLLELWCISVTDVLLESSFSMFWFNSSDSGRIFLSELVLQALWLQIIIPSAVVLLLPSEWQPFAKGIHLALEALLGRGKKIGW